VKLERAQKNNKKKTEEKTRRFKVKQEANFKILLQNKTKEQ
jgi:hypothetical protein